MHVPRWLQLSIVGVVIATAVQLSASWAACTFIYGPRLLQLHAGSNGQLPLGQGCDGAGDKAAAGFSALLATLLGLASQPPEP